MDNKELFPAVGASPLFNTSHNVGAAQTCRPSGRPSICHLFGPTQDDLELSAEIVGRAVNLSASAERYSVVLCRCCVKDGEHERSVQFGCCSCLSWREPTHSWAEGSVQLRWTHFLDILDLFL